MKTVYLLLHFDYECIEIHTYQGRMKGGNNNENLSLPTLSGPLLRLCIQSPPLMSINLLLFNKHYTFVKLTFVSACLNQTRKVLGFHMLYLPRYQALGLYLMFGLHEIPAYSWFG